MDNDTIARGEQLVAEVMTLEGGAWSEAELYEQLGWSPAVLTDWRCNYGVVSWQKVSGRFYPRWQFNRAELPSLFTTRELPSLYGEIGEWNELIDCWKAWADAARLLSARDNCEERLKQLRSAEEYNLQLRSTQEELESATREWMTWATGGLPNMLSPSDREALANLRAGIQNWGPERFTREMRANFPLILRAFPLWSVSNLSARSALPLVPGLFELAIVDEACQSDIASVIPLLARSRRAIMVGDPMQLRHVSNLDSAVEQTLLNQYELTNGDLQRFTYRVNSAFDLVEANPNVPDDARVRLDLHFRSHGGIADYCNEAFYAKTLHVVTATEKLNIPQGVCPGIHWTQIVGRLTPGTTGVWCAEEIEAVLKELKYLALKNFEGTIGIVTPFRQQMIRLWDALEGTEAVSRAFRDKTQLQVDTAYGFQGGERDLILFSLCGGPNLPTGGQLFFRNDANQFNVAVSRARAVLHVIGNQEWASTCGISYLEKLAKRGRNQNQTSFRKTGLDLYQSPWEEKLALALKSAGIDCVPQYPIAGRFLDLAVLNGVKLDIEVDGESVHRTAGGGRKDDDHWRDLQLESLGWKVLRFWVYRLREDMPSCIKSVEKAVCTQREHKEAKVRTK